MRFSPSCSLMFTLSIGLMRSCDCDSVCLFHNSNGCEMSHFRDFREINIFSQLENVDTTKLFMHRTIKWYEEHGTISIYKEINPFVQENLIKCAKDEIRRIAREVQINWLSISIVIPCSVLRWLKNDLEVAPFKKWHPYGLCIENM